MPNAFKLESMLRKAAVEDKSVSESGVFPGAEREGGSPKMQEAPALARIQPSSPLVSKKSGASSTVGPQRRTWSS